MARKASMRRRDAADDAGEDDEADAVADALLGDQLAQPHQRGSSPRSGSRSGSASRRLPRSNGVMTGMPPAICAGQDGEEAVGLEERHRHGQVAGVLVDLVAAVLAFALRAPAARGRRPVISCMMIEALMYGFTPEADDREVRQAAAREQVQQAEEARCPSRNVASAVGFDARHRDVGQRTEDDAGSPATNRIRRRMSGARNGVEQRLEHCVSARRTCLAEPASGHAAARRRRWQSRAGRASPGGATAFGPGRLRRRTPRRPRRARRASAPAAVGSSSTWAVPPAASILVARAPA